MNILRLTTRTFHLGKSLQKSKIYSRFILKDAKSQKRFVALLSQRTLSSSDHSISIKSNDVNLLTHNAVAAGLLQQQHNTHKYFESNHKYIPIIWQNSQLFFIFALGSLIGTMCWMKKKQLKSQGPPVQYAFCFGACITFLIKCQKFLVFSCLLEIIIIYFNFDFTHHK